MMNNDVVIGRPIGKPPCSAGNLFIDGVDMSENSQCYRISNIFGKGLSFRMMVYKNTPEGEDITALVVKIKRAKNAAGVHEKKLISTLRKIYLANVDTDTFSDMLVTFVNNERDMAYMKGKRDRSKEFRDLLVCDY